MPPQEMPPEEDYADKSVASTVTTGCLHDRIWWRTEECALNGVPMIFIGVSQRTEIVLCRAGNDPEAPSAVAIRIACRGGFAFFTSDPTVIDGVLDESLLGDFSVLLEAIDLNHHTPNEDEPDAQPFLSRLEQLVREALEH
jgi:hypothetical protein